MVEKENGTIVSKNDKTTCACGVGCNCGCGCWHTHHLVWWFIGVVALIIVFCLGIKLGEFAAEIHSMESYYNYRAYPMMRTEGYGGAHVTPATPVNGVATSSAGTNIPVY